MIGILIWLIIGILVIFEISPWLGAIFILAYLFLFIIKIHKDFGGDAPIQVQKKDICEIHELSYENGQIQTRCNYINGEIFEVYEFYYDDGQTDNTISHQRRHLREIANSHHQTIKEKAICPPL